MTTSDELSTLMVLATVLERAPATAAECATFVDTLATPWAKRIGGAMIQDAAVGASSQVAAPVSAAPGGLDVNDLGAVRRLAGLDLDGPKATT